MAFTADVPAVKLDSPGYVRIPIALYELPHGTANAAFAFHLDRHESAGGAYEEVLLQRRVLALVVEKTKSGLGKSLGDDVLVKRPLEHAKVHVRPEIALRRIVRRRPGAGKATAPASADARSIFFMVALFSCI